MKLITILLSVILLYLAVSLLTIIKNGVSLTNVPGFGERFKRFMTTHIAQTAENHSYPELVSEDYAMSVDELKLQVMKHAETLGWSLNKDLENNANDSSINYIVTTPIAKFKDDIVITLTAVNPTKTTLNVRSKSRVGRADFAANIGHILKLKKLLKSN